MRDDPVVITLVPRARDGDQHAWNEIVDRYAPLVWSICKRYELSRHDIDDIGQTVWLLLVEQLGNLRQPVALGGWLAATHTSRVPARDTGSDQVRPFPVTRRQPGAARSAAGDDRPGGDRGEAEGRASRGVRRASGPLPETAVPAAQRAPDLLRGDQRPAPHSHREHRPAAWPMPPPAAPLSLPHGLHRRRPPGFRRRERPLQGHWRCAECRYLDDSSSWLR